MSDDLFDTTKRPVSGLLAEIGSGAIQLPDFQRGWVWDDEHIVSLLESMSKSFPIGAVMTLETGGAAQFKARLVEGVDPAQAGQSPETLILDGQQRLTSLYQALMTRQAVATRDTKGKRWRRHYCFDMRASVGQPSPHDGDSPVPVRSVPEDRMVKTFRGEVALDLSSQEAEFAECMFPADLMFDSKRWRREFSSYWRGRDPDMAELWDAFEEQVIERFEKYQIPVIELRKATSKEAICTVFEKVNTGGVSLTVFELLTASFAANDFLLRNDWAAREERLKTKFPVLSALSSDQFLQAATLCVTQERERERVVVSGGSSRVGCRREEVLSLETADYVRWADRIEEGFGRVARFLDGQHIYRAKDVPYQSQLVPLAAALVELGTDAETQKAQEAIARWYWCGVMGELYGGSTETRFAKDFPELVALVRGGRETTTTISDAYFQASRLRTLRTRNSAAYKGLYALLMRDGAKDFLTGERLEKQIFFGDSIDIHHVFPKRWCEAQDPPIEPAEFNSIVNKSAISARTNQVIGGRAPSDYLKRLDDKPGASSAATDAVLKSHLIPAPHLRNGDFKAYIAERSRLLVELVEQAMGKEAMRDFDEIDDDYVDESPDYDDAA